ncbi:hypothetical protein [Pedobacter metabolipauper]|uniref:Uncharacterized protein n=1 Tax=Pedobacter metabolipauper TaxID=425513 RepID=A0A4V3D0Y6_9SPHI|nr:hypothetical protein [Pedobacter metabolipauper]TDQ08214.1 hypothetical protein ATK78_2721 [Pedobacter metabolipauper]
MNAYKNEWIEILLKKDFPGWLIGADKNDIIIQIPDDQDLDKVAAEFSSMLSELQKKIKSKPTMTRFFIGNSKDSRYCELN